MGDMYNIVGCYDEWILPTLFANVATFLVELWQWNQRCTVCKPHTGEATCSMGMLQIDTDWTFRESGFVSTKVLNDTWMTYRCSWLDSAEERSRDWDLNLIGMIPSDKRKWVSGWDKGRKPKEHLSWAIVGVSFGKYIMLTMRANQNQSLSGVSEAISNGLQNRFTTLTAGQGVNYSMFTSQSSTALTDIRNWRPANLGYWFSSSPRNGGENDQCWAIWWSRTWSPFLFVLFSPFFLRATSPRFKNG